MCVLLLLKKVIHIHLKVMGFLWLATELVLEEYFIMLSANTLFTKEYIGFHITEMFNLGFCIII